MKIGIDARALIKHKTGIGYYINDLLKTILEHDINNEYFLIGQKDIYFANADKYPNLMLIQDTKFKGKQTVWFYFYSHNIINKLNLDAYWCTQYTLPFFLNKNIKKILTIYDMVCYEFPNTMQSTNKWINKIFLPYSLKKADKVIAISESTREGIFKYFTNIDKNKVKVSLAAFTNYYSLENGPQVIPDKIRILAGEVFILYVGTIEPRKNLALLINAHCEIYKKHKIRLVICGKLGWKSNSIRDIITDSKNINKILYLNYVSDSEKFYLMQNCFAFVCPSLYEGFGLPVLEAMSFGALTLASNNSSLKEVVGNSELLFDINSPKELVDKLIYLYENVDKYNQLKKYCEKRAKEFSWNKSAIDYIAAFNSFNKLN